MIANRTLLAVTVLGGTVAAASAQTSSLQLPIANGPFQPTMASLTEYEYPGWLRDAKFGIWSHWRPQAVPMKCRTQTKPRNQTRN